MAIATISTATFIRAPRVSLINARTRWYRLLCCFQLQTAKHADQCYYPALFPQLYSFEVPGNLPNSHYPYAKGPSSTCATRWSSRKAQFLSAGIGLEALSLSRKYLTWSGAICERHMKSFCWATPGKGEEGKAEIAGLRLAGYLYEWLIESGIYTIRGAWEIFDTSSKGWDTTRYGWNNWKNIKPRLVDLLSNINTPVWHIRALLAILS